MPHIKPLAALALAALLAACTSAPPEAELHTPKHLPIPIHNKPAFFAVATDKKAAWK